VLKRDPRRTELAGGRVSNRLRLTRTVLECLTETGKQALLSGRARVR